MADGRYWNLDANRLVAGSNHDTLFSIGPSLVGQDGAVSFRSSADGSNDYIRHSGYVCSLAPLQSTTLYRQDASYVEIQEARGIRYQSVNYRGFSLAIQESGRIAIVRYDATNNINYLWRELEGNDNNFDTIIIIKIIIIIIMIMIMIIIIMITTIMIIIIL